MSGPPKSFWRKYGFLTPLLFLIVILAPMVLVPSWSARFIAPPLDAVHGLVSVLRVALIAAQWLLFLGEIATGTWNSFKARSGKTLFLWLILWLIYVPIIVGFLAWKMTDRSIWLIVFFGGMLVEMTHRYHARRHGLA